MDVGPREDQKNNCRCDKQGYGLAVVSFCHALPTPLLDHRSEAALLHFREASLHLGIGVKQLLTCQKPPKICGSLTRPVQIVFFI